MEHVDVLKWTWCIQSMRGAHTGGLRCNLKQADLFYVTSLKSETVTDLTGGALELDLSQFEKNKAGGRAGLKSNILLF